MVHCLNRGNGPLFRHVLVLLDKQLEFGTVFVDNDIAMKWEKIGNNYPMEKDMFPAIIRRDDGKLFYIKSYPNLLKRKWLDCVSWVIGHRWTHIVMITDPMEIVEVLKKKNNELMDIECVPTSALELLYSKRLFEDTDVPFEEYTKRYCFIVCDDVIYYGASDWERVRRYISSSSEFNKMTLPDAIVVGDKVLKNRYGNRSV